MDTNHQQPNNKPGQEREENYLESARRSFARIWYNRFLWWWGLFLPTGFYLSLPDVQAPLEQPLDDQSAEIARQAAEFMQRNSDYIMIATGVALLVLFLVWLVSSVARSGVIRTLDLLQNNQASKEFRIGYIWQVGRRGALDILKLDLLILVTLLSVMVILVIPLAVLAKLIDPMSFGFLSLFAFVIFMPLVFLGVFLRSIGAIHITLAHQRTIPAIEVSYLQLTRNFREGLKIFFLITTIEIMKMMALIATLSLVLLITAGSLSLIGTMGEEFINSIELYILVFAGLVMLGLYLWIKSIFSLWSIDLWLWWAKKFGGIKIEELADTPEKEVLMKKTEPAVGRAE